MASLLEFRTISYRYPRQEGYAVRDLTFAVQPGEFLGILGADHAGKTTLARLSNGGLRPTHGQVRNAAVTTPTSEQTTPRQLHVGVVFADPENQIVGATVEEDIAFGLGNLGLASDVMRSRIDTYLERVGLSHAVYRAPHHLSGGEQQKLCLAGILAMEPACVVLDEPLTFLDSASRREMLALIAEFHAGGTTMVYLSSDPEELRYATRILVLRSGRLIAECAFADLWTNEILLERAGILPSDMMRFYALLRRHGYSLSPTSLTPEAVAHDLCSPS